MTLVWITCGLLVAVLFVAGYLLQQRRSRFEAMFTMRESVTLDPHGGNGNSQGYVPTVRCWEIKECALAKRDRCPAYDRTYLPCWLARKLENGHRLQRSCLECVLYQPERVVEGVAPAAETTAEASRPGQH